MTATRQAQGRLREARRAGVDLWQAARAQGRALHRTQLVQTHKNQPVCLLGARQLPGAVPLEGGAEQLRRYTTGTAAWACGRLLWHQLALPTPDAVLADGTRANLLNRNVRGWLRAYRSVGAKAAYFGREVIVGAGRPLGVLACDVGADGDALLELFVGIDAPAVVKASAPARPAVALGELLGAEAVSDPEALRVRLDRAMAKWLGLEASEVGAVATADALREQAPQAPQTPEPEPLEAWAAFAGTAAEEVVEGVPIGSLVARRDDAGRCWVGGDVLASNGDLDAVQGFDPEAVLDAEAALGRPPFLLGASLSDVAVLLRRLQAVRKHSE